MTQRRNTRSEGPLLRAWRWVRQVTGDAAYENYLRGIHHRGMGTESDSGAGLMSRSEFYLDSLRRRYSTPSRCC